MSVIRAAYVALFAKLVSLVAYRDSRRSENQRFLRDLFHWSARFVFLNSVPASLGDPSIVILRRVGATWCILGPVLAPTGF